MLTKITIYRTINYVAMLLKWRHKLGSLVTGRSGALMVETVVAVGLMAIVGTAVLSGLSTAHLSGASTERQSTAENIARNQMSFIFSEPYVNNTGTYQSVATPNGYGVTADTEEVDPLNFDPDIQKVVVTVTFDGKTELVLESIKVRP